MQTTDISWAKSDVFIWSSVEPSVGIISGCLPTLRPLLLQVTSTLSSTLGSSHKSSQHTESPAHTLNPLETISKKRTRKIVIKDTFDDTLATQDERRGETKSWIKSKSQHEHWGRSRLDEDEICLTTTTVQVSDKEGSKVESTEIPRDEEEGRRITMTKEFAWDERTRSRGADP